MACLAKFFTLRDRRLTRTFVFHKILERNRSESAEDYPEVLIAKQYEELLSDESVDVVVVNTRNPHHYDMATAALEAGKHVVEKSPLPIPLKKQNV